VGRRCRRGRRDEGSRSRSAGRSRRQLGVDLRLGFLMLVVVDVVGAAALQLLVIALVMLPPPPRKLEHGDRPKIRASRGGDGTGAAVLYSAWTVTGRC